MDSLRITISKRNSKPHGIGDVVDHTLDPLKKLSVGLFQVKPTKSQRHMLF